MKKNVAFSAYEFRGITPQCPEAEMLWRMNKLQVNVSSLTQGAYNYKYLVNNVVKHTGKIILD